MLRNFTLLLATILIVASNTFSQKAEDWCGTDHILEQMFNADPEYRDRYFEELKAFNKQAQEYDPSKSKTTFIIPTVVHVMHFNGNGNISEAQVIDGLNQINEDLKRLNADSGDTRSFFKQFAGSMDVEFRLAKIDPSGNCTNGIVRVNDAASNNWTSADHAISRWPNDKYFNIWIVNDIFNFTGGGGVILGYAYYPGFSGLNPNYGLVNRNDAWGRIGNIVYSGRTPTHEVGHALNLPHTFNAGCPDVLNGEDCSNSGDFVCDTPPASSPTQGCNLNLNSCDEDTVGPSPFTTDMKNQIENYMSYDDCQNMFSAGQVNRMQSALNNTSNAAMQNLTSTSNLIATGTDDAYYFTAPDCAPVAEFSSNKKINCAGGEINFVDLSYNAVIDSTWQWNWTFQGGTPATSTDRNPTVVFNQAGNYDVSLTVTNAQGTSPIETKNSYLNIIPGSGNFIGPITESFSAAEFPGNNNDQTLAWSIENPQGGGNTWQRSTNAFFNGPSSAYLNNFNISNEEFHSLITPVTDLTQMSQAFMNFRIAYARKNNEVEVLKIYASKDCGSTWRQISSQLSIDLYSATWPSGSAFLPAGPGQWRPFSLDISRYAGQDNIMFKLEFKARGGNDLYIDEFEIAENGLNVSLDVEKLSSNARVYPNPSTGIVQIEGSNIEIIEVVDLVGRKLISKRNVSRSDKISMNLSELEKGIYFININGESQSTEKSYWSNMDRGVIPVIYNEGIYVVEEKESKSVQEAGIQINGNTASRVMCVFLEENNASPSPEQLTMVSNLLNAINITAQDHCWVSNAEIFNQKDRLKEVVFLFQHSSFDIFAHTSLHEWQELSGTQTFVTYALSELEKDKSKKQELWSAIKNFRME